jgi:uroporphyrinogen decarboxylase
MSPDDPPVRVYSSPATLDAIHHLCGLQQFCYLHADHPELVADWLDARTEAAVAHAHAIVELGLSPVAAHGEDIACKGRTIYSPVMLRELLFPRLTRIVQAWHEHGVKIMFHSDGYLMDVLDDLLACGFDGLHPIETVAGMDLGEVRRRVGNRMFICGGIDVSQLLPFGSVAAVRAECDRAVQVAAPGYFIGSTTEMNAVVPLRNVRAVYETPYRLSGLPPPPPGAG